VSPPTKGGKRGAFQNVRDVAGCGITLILYLLGLVLAGALLIGISVLIPAILERTAENARELGWNPESIALGLTLIGLGVFFIRPLVNNRMRGQFWVDMPLRPRVALAWSVACLTSGVAFLFYGLRVP